MGSRAVCLASFFILSCASHIHDAPADAGPCTEGATKACACPLGQGVATCGRDGRFGGCDCGSAIDPGTEPDAGETDQTSCTPLAWYPDVDKDGFGDALAQPTMACAAPAGFVADHTDCADQDERANPLQQLPQEGPVKGVGGGDFNCDGMQVPVAAPTNRSCQPPCGGSAGWVSSAPACGTTGTWMLSCNVSGNPNICQAPTTEQRLQKCL